MTLEALETSIQDYFFSTKGHKPGSDENLFDSGLLDSFGVVEFLTFLEAHLGVSMNLEDITAENFSTIRSVSRLVHRQSGEPA